MRLETPQSRCRVAVGRCDITPPVGIYHRMWGAATHDRSTGLHRPLTATVLILQSGTAEAPSAQILIAVDHCLMWHREMQDLLDAISRQAAVPRDWLHVCFSHTHGAGLMGSERTALPGGELILPYLQNIATLIAAEIGICQARLQPAAIVYGYGRCDLAANRDFFDEERQRHYCGYNPRAAADDTLLVARVTRCDGTPLATLVNYACHPTTLAWENTRISPDYLGAMRDVVESVTRVPCFFVQGASAELGPREGFCGDEAVADRNGRRLGYAALAALEALPDANTAYAYQGPVVSGATLAIWRPQPASPGHLDQAAIWKSGVVEIPLDYRPDLPTPEELERELTQGRDLESTARATGDEAAVQKARALVERTTRRIARQATLPPGPAYPYQIHAFRAGDAVWLLLDGEHYSLLQRALRERFNGRPLVIGTIVNGSDVWYLPDQASFGKGLYQEEVSILCPGSLERVIDAAGGLIESLYQAPSPG